MLLVLAGLAVGAYLVWRPSSTPVPEIATTGLDAEVVAAIEQARAEVKAHPRTAAAWGRLGMVLFAQDIYDAATLTVFAEAERLDPRDARWPYFRGLTLILYKPDEGIRFIEQAVQITPTNLSLRLRLAEEYLKLDRVEDADRLFQSLVNDYPDNPRVLLGQGQILTRRGKLEEALAPLETAAKNPTARRSGPVALAETYLRLGKPAPAEAARRQAAESPADLAWPDEYLAQARALRTGLQPRIDRASIPCDCGASQRLEWFTAR